MRTLSRRLVSTVVAVVAIVMLTAVPASAAALADSQVGSTEPRSVAPAHHDYVLHRIGFPTWYDCHVWGTEEMYNTEPRPYDYFECRQVAPHLYEWELWVGWNHS